AYKKLERWQSEGGHGDFHKVRLEALLEVGPSVFFSLLVIAVAFRPIFTLVDQEGRLFRPLAWTKNLTMFMAALLAVTLDPALRMMFTRMHWSHFRPFWLSRVWNTVTVGRYYPEERHPISRGLFAVYEPACRFALRHPKAVIAAAMHFPGTTNAWTMPIKNRIDMLTTGIRTPIGIKVFGPDLKRIEAVGQRVEEVVRRVKGTRSVFAERVAGGYFLDFDLKRENLARYGLTVADAQAAIMSAVGGENVTTTIAGRARFPVSVRYPRELRDDLEHLSSVLVRTPTGAQVPLGQLADLRTVQGPSMVRNE